MEIAKRYGAFGIKFTGDVTINGPMIDIHDNGRVYVHTEKMGSTVDQECDEEWEAVRLKFFDMKKYGSDEKQQQLRKVLRYASTKIDVNSGRDWFCVYAAARYAEGCLGSKLEYVEFFSDIELLLPGILKRMNQQESGNKRYKPYSELLRREADSWFVFDGGLPPINEMVYKPCFGCTEDQFRRSSKIIKDLYRRLKDI